MDPTVLAPAAAGGPAAYDAEIRFGVVMYGGVSLAIYINGVANELYEMACSTPKGGAAPAAEGTRRVYRWLSGLVGDPAARARWMQRLAGGEAIESIAASEAGTSSTRFAVDVIAGTSAGGINGMFLAKALANGESFGALRRLWVEEGDIGRLLNDRKSFNGLGSLKYEGQPRSLLNSDRMYLKLVDAMEGLKSDPALRENTNDGPASRVAEEIDLFVTTTDIRGSAVPLRLFDGVVHERRHKQVYHFRYGGVGTNDFETANIPFLAFAARCTSSFPFAFEPMQLEHVRDVLTGAGRWSWSQAQWGEHFARWQRFFDGLESSQLERGDHLRLSFGDGGYLDNKPFSYVVEQLSQRQAMLPIQRKLLYIEPAPERVNAAAGPGQAPDALENSLAALTSIPRYETIREDLEAVLKRNRRIERVELLVRRVEAEIDSDGGMPPLARQADAAGKVPRWRDLDLRGVARCYGHAFLPYLRLRIVTVTDDLSARLARRWGVDERSDDLYAFRALIRAWREDTYVDMRDPPTNTAVVTANEFLATFDIAYRVRSVAMLVRRAHQVSRLLRARHSVRERPQDLAVADQQALARLRGLGLDLALLDDAAAARAQEAVDRLEGGIEAALRDFRRLAKLPSLAEDWLPAPPAEAVAELRQVLDFVLRGWRPDQAPLALAGLGGGKNVEVKFDLLEAPGSARTLQEAVFGRARQLYRAGKASRTDVQEALEQGLRLIGQRFGEAVLNGPGLHVKQLLGQPEVASDGERAVRLQDVGVPALDNAEARLLREYLATYFVRFDEFDQISFPLYYDTGTGEPATVDIVRISPGDATALIDERTSDRRKLAGTALANFGAFLEQRWRRNDLMWGRLDGAERLIASLLPYERDAALRDALIAQAHRAIVHEELTPQGHAELTRLMLPALAATGERDANRALAELQKCLAAQDPTNQRRVGAVLASLLEPEGLRSYMREHYEVDRGLESRPMMSNAARAVTVAGQVLDGIAHQRQTETSMLRWVARAGLVAQAALAVSVPGAWRARLFRHWVALVYVFAAVIFVGSLLFGAEGARTFALTLLTVTALAHLLVAVIEDVLRGGKLRRSLLVVAVIAVVALAALGGWTAWQTAGRWLAGLSL
jgi:patatin-related protein